MAKGSFRIEGVQDLKASFQDLPKATGRNVLKRVLLKHGQPFESAMEAGAPRESGLLIRRIAVSQKLSKRQMAVHRKQVGTAPKLTVAGFRSAPAKAVYVFVGAGPLPHAHMQEFGTARHGPKPFARPAWDANKTTAFQGIADDMKAEIMAAAARAARRAAKTLAKMKMK
jgi:HK97 gp10 family phage protein